MSAGQIASQVVLIFCTFALLNCDVDSAPLPEATLRDQLTELARKRPQRIDYHIRRVPQTVAGAQTIRPIVPNPLHGSAPPPSPGLSIGVTWLDMQHSHSLSKQISRNPGENHVQMVWNSIQNFDASGVWNITEVMYNTFRINTGTLHPGFGGYLVSLGPLARGFGANIAVDDQGMAHATYAQREDLAWPRTPMFSNFLAPGHPFHSEDVLYPSGACGEALWPKLAIQQRDGADDLHHVISQSGSSCDDTRLFYWRYANSAWSGPVIIDSVFSNGYIIVTDDNSDNMAILFHDIDEPQSNGANNISYYISTTAGAGFLNGTELGPSNKLMLTTYSDTLNGPQAWKQIDAQYDNSGRLHVVWDEQQLANKTANVIVRHWNDERNTVRPVVIGNWPAPPAQNSLNLSSLSLGIGDGLTNCTSSPDGENLDFLYLTFTKFGGLTTAEQGDTSAAGFPNGEIYLTISADAGSTWSSPENLTETKTPDCNPATPGNECRSEDWGSINRTISDIDIIYVSDLDAGAAAQGEGTYQPDSVKYLRILGGTTDAEHLCVALAPRFDAFLSSNTNCEYNAAPGGMQGSEVLTIHNLGPGTLEGEIAVMPGATWLTVSGDGDYTIPSGGASLEFPLSMDAALLSEGVYTGVIRVTHNDPQLPVPMDYLVKFYVIEDFICSQKVVMSTGVE